MIRPTSPPAALALSLACCLAASGCGHGSQTAHDLLDKYPTPIYSLTGEQLNGGPLGRPKCEDAQAGWLARVDTDRDGTVDLDELLTNARAQFDVMNIDRSGKITADQLATYRAPFALSSRPEPAPDKDGPDAGADDSGTDKSPSKGDARHRNERNGDRPQGVRPPSSQPDPVLAADGNLDFEVTLDEYLIQQRESFMQLDKNKDRHLSSDELAVLCHVRERAAIR